MTDLEVLFVVLVALYLAAAGHWYRGDAELFRAAARAWRRAEPLGAFRGGDLKVVFADLLPPLHGIAICAELPFRISPAGVCTAAGEVLRWEGAEFRADDHKLYAGAAVLGEFRTEEQARQWRDRLQHIAATRPQQREANLRRTLGEMFDASVVRERRAEFARRTRWLRRLCNLMFFWLFVIGPLSVQLLGLGLTWLPLLLGVIVLLVLIGRGFVRAHRALYPQERGARFRHTLGLALSPPAAARAADLLLLDLFAGLHALAVAAVVLAGKDFARYAGATLRGLKYPLAEELGDEPAAIAGWHRRELLAAAERFAERHGIELADVYAVPEPESSAVVAYCPRCRMQYLNEAATCADCSGVALSRYETAAALAAR